MGSGEWVGWGWVGGEGGIRTRAPGFPDHLISSQRRYDRFGTSPEAEANYITFAFGMNCGFAAPVGIGIKLSLFRRRVGRRRRKK